MSIAVNVNDPTNTGVNSTSSATGSSSLTGSNASDLQSSFLTLLVAQPLQFALVQGVIKGSDGNKLDLGTSGTTTLDEVRQII